MLVSSRAAAVPIPRKTRAPTNWPKFCEKPAKSEPASMKIAPMIWMLSIISSFCDTAPTRGIFRPKRSIIQAMTNVEGILGLLDESRNEHEIFVYLQVVGSGDEAELCACWMAEMGLPSGQSLQAVQ